MFTEIYDTYYNDKSKHEYANVKAAYEAVCDELIELNGTPSSHVLTVVYREELVKEGLEHHVLLCEESQVYGVDFVHWESIVDADVEYDGEIYKDYQALAHMLWEMTFYGFTAEKIRSGAEEMNQLVKSTDKGINLEEFNLDDL